MSVTPMPTTRQLNGLLTMLVGRDCQLEPAEEHLVPEAKPGLVVGTYVTEQMRGNAIVALDSWAAAYLGAAIALIPAGTAAEAGESGVLPEALLDNASEVLNVVSSLFNAEDAPHLKLADVHTTASGPIPGDVASWLRGNTRRSDLLLDVAGYGQGRVSVVLA